ncbi:MAG: Nramp family divalent metal transporter [Armatimonadota bacterium]
MVLGPGIITSFADNDAGGIATYSQAGAAYQYELLWMLGLVTIALGVVQEMCARMGAVTQKGLGELIREEYGVRWALFALITMFVANLGTTCAEFAGIAMAFQVLGVSMYLAVPIAAFLIWFVVTRGSFRTVERIFLALCLLFFTYVGSGVMAKPDWTEVARGLFVPSFRLERHYIVLFIAVIGTTITPWMQFFLQSTVVDKGIHIREYRYTRLDVIVGAFFTDFVAFFIVVAAGATLFVHGRHEIRDAYDAAVALQPFAGANATLLFAIGLLAASMLSGAVLPLTTAYSFCETFGWEFGVSRSWKEAPVFFGIFTLSIVLGVGIVLTSGMNPIHLAILTQVLNGLLLPVVLIFMVKLINNPRIMGKYVNTRTGNVICWVTTASIIALAVTYTVLMLFGA